MKRTYSITILAAFVLGIATLCALAGCKGKPRVKAAAPVLRNVTLNGDNYCFGCDLKKSRGAKSQCSLHGHQHALKVTEARDSEGGELKSLNGLVLHYLATDAAQPLLKEGLHGDSLEVRGNVFTNERVLELVSFKDSE